MTSPVRAQLERMLEDTPFAPGDGPFRTKGNVYRALLESADRRVPGNHRAVLASLTDPKLVRFFSQPFLAGASYDVLPLVPFGVVGARLVNMPYPEFVRGGAAFAAERDMRGIYKFLLRFTSPTAMVQRMPKILLQYFNFGRVEGRFLSERVYEAVVSDIPQPVNLWLMNVAHGFMPIVMKAAGARDVRLVVGPATVDGRRHGIDLLRATLTLEWSPP